jgi:hypothetical protein
MDCPSVYEMPLPVLAVSHRERVKPDFVSPLPVPSVTVEPDAPVVTDAVVYGVVGSSGAVPPVCPLPLYAMVGRHVPEYPLRVRNGYPPCVPEQMDHVVPVETPLPGLTPLVMGQLRLSES